MLSKSSRYDIVRSQSLHESPGTSRTAGAAQRKGKPSSYLIPQTVDTSISVNGALEGSYRRLCVSPIAWASSLPSPVSAMKSTRFSNDPKYSPKSVGFKGFGVSEKHPNAGGKFPQNCLVTKLRQSYPSVEGKGTSALTGSRISIPQQVFDSLPESRVDPDVGATLAEKQGGDADDSDSCIGCRQQTVTTPSAEAFGAGGEKGQKQQQRQHSPRRGKVSSQGERILAVTLSPSASDQVASYCSLPGHRSPKVDDKSGRSQKIQIFIPGNAGQEKGNEGQTLQSLPQPLDLHSPVNRELYHKLQLSPASSPSPSRSPSSPPASSPSLMRKDYPGGTAFGVFSTPCGGQLKSSPNPSPAAATAGAPPPTSKPTTGEQSEQSSEAATESKDIQVCAVNGNTYNFRLSVPQDLPPEDIASFCRSMIQEEPVVDNSFTTDYPYKGKGLIARKPVLLHSVSPKSGLHLNGNGNLVNNGHQDRSGKKPTPTDSTSPTLRSPTIVKEMMKKVSTLPSGGFSAGTLFRVTETSRSQFPSSQQVKVSQDPTAKELEVIEELDKSIEAGMIGNGYTPSYKSQPNKPPRKCTFGSSTLHETDNLVEEIYLSPEPGERTTMVHKPPKAVLPTKSPAAVSDNDNDYENAVTTLRASVSSLDSGTSSHVQTHFIVVAIDFGTTYSGYAFSFTRDPSNIHMMRKWDGGGDPDVNNHKTPTTLLLTPDHEFHSFGFNARDAYHNLPTKDSKRYLYFEKFKMTLHTTEVLTRDTQIRATNGKSLSALTVFAHTLRYFKQHALQELTDQCGATITDEDVRWVVTVPAIWKQPAKQFMRAAAYEAGMASPDHPEQLLIALEPEAASIYCRRLRLNQLIPESAPQRFSYLAPNGPTNASKNNDEKAVAEEKGTRYMVVDCGGGTVDITVHEIQDKQGSLKELHKATGGPHGSIGVDLEFEKLLGQILGLDFIEYYKNKLPSGYVDLMANFEGRKRSANTYQTTPSNITLPFSLINSFRKWKGHTIESAVKKYDSNQISYCSKLGMLRLQPVLILKLFDPTTKEILNHITSVLASPLVDGIQYLFLVGGFAESQILQQAIRKAFTAMKIKVIIPQGVSLAILRGAALFGLDPTIISIRRSRMTYGIGVLNRFIHGIHPLSKRIVRDNIEWCADVFDKFVVTDQSIGFGDCVTRSYTPAKDGQRYTVLHIYSSERDDPRFITDEGVQRCGTLVLDLDPDAPMSSTVSRKSMATEGVSADGAPNGGHTRREIQTKMVFGDTELKVWAIDLASDKSVRAEIDFLCQ